MDPRSLHGRSELFLVRMWEQRVSDNQTICLTDTDGDNLGNTAIESQAEWCGTVQHTVSGTTRSFKGLNGLNGSLLEMFKSLIQGE